MDRAQTSTTVTAWSDYVHPLWLKVRVRRDMPEKGPKLTNTTHIRYGTWYIVSALYTAMVFFKSIRPWYVVNLPLSIVGTFSISSQFSRKPRETRRADVCVIVICVRSFPIRSIYLFQRTQENNGTIWADVLPRPTSAFLSASQSREKYTPNWRVGDDMIHETKKRYHTFHENMKNHRLERQQLRHHRATQTFGDRSQAGRLVINSTQ